MPGVIEAYAKTIKASFKVSKPDDQHDVYELTLAGLATPYLRLTVASLGSNAALSGLIDKRAQIGLTSRPFSDAEIATLLTLRGSGTRKDIERVIALDGIVIVANPAAQVTSLKLCEVARIYSGQIRNWSEVGGAALPITLHVRDANSGTFELFKSVLLAGCGVTLAPTAIPHATTDSMSAAVAGNAGAIGFAGSAATVGNAALTVRPLKISSACGIEHLATAFNVKTEDYPLSRRLYLLTPVPLSKNAQSFVDFLSSDFAEEAVSRSSAVSQGIETLGSDPRVTGRYQTGPGEDAIGILRRQTDGAQRMSITYRFNFGSTVLDIKAAQDIRRLARYLQAHPGRRVLIAGFTDGIGRDATNLRLSRERANVVQQALLGTGAGLDPAKLITDGFGAIIPVACNDTDLGREKNRRVEAWLLP